MCFLPQAIQGSTYNVWMLTSLGVYVTSAFVYSRVFLILRQSNKCARNE